MSNALARKWRIVVTHHGAPDMARRGLGVAMSQDHKPNKHDGDRDGQGTYQPGKTEKPKDYGRGRHDKKDDPPPKKDQ